jgi:hypothetical protein
LLESIVTEQKANIKFSFKADKTVTETFQLVKQAYGDNAVSRTLFSMVCEWFERVNTDMRIFTMIQEAGVPQPLEMKAQPLISVKWWYEIVAGLSE